MESVIKIKCIMVTWFYIFWEKKKKGQAFPVTGHEGP
jgi:hypothetical protein